MIAHRPSAHCSLASRPQRRSPRSPSVWRQMLLAGSIVLAGTSVSIVAAAPAAAASTVSAYACFQQAYTLYNNPAVYFTAMAAGSPVQIHVWIPGYGAFHALTVYTAGNGCAYFNLSTGSYYRVFVDYRSYPLHYEGGSEWALPSQNNWYFGRIYVVMVKG